MVPVARGADDAAMTTERTDAALPTGPQVAYRRLERRTADRVIGGVAGGLADYLNVDPLLIRVGFAGLMLFSGAGLPLYLLGWLFIPASGRADSIAMSSLRELLQHRALVVALGVLLVLLFLISPVREGLESAYYYTPPELFWALGIAIVGVLLLLPRGRAGAAGAGAGIAAQPAGVAGRADAPDSWQPAAPVTAAVSRPTRPASPLGWYAVAGASIAVGLVAIYDSLARRQVALADYFGTALLVLGVGLVVGAWWGRARLLILLGLAALPFALASAFVSVPLVGGIGDNYFGPQSVQEVRSDYRLAGGTLYLDLSALAGEHGPVSMAASVGVGKIVVIVPNDADVDVTGSAGGGRLSLLHIEQAGTSLEQRVVGDRAADATTIVLRLEVGIGDIDVERAHLESDELGG
jgi:phage shock protein PspC (stress-responsive transcriptional regulator)